jgi:hypothetical protein
MSVAKPWIEASPDPTIFQSLSGSPGSAFSHAIALAQLDALTVLGRRTPMLAMAEARLRSSTRSARRRGEPGVRLQSRVAR